MRLLTVNRSTELHSDLVAEALVRDGLVLIQQGTLPELRALLASWTRPVDHPHQAGSGLTIVTPRPSAEGQHNKTGFTSSALPPHTDRSLDRRPPSLVAGLMLSPAPAGGHAVLVDGARVLRVLRRDVDDEAIRAMRLRLVNGAIGPAVVELRDGAARLRYRNDRVAVPYGASGRASVVAAFQRLIDADCESINLAAGDGYLAHNHRFLHGRTGFTGDRRFARLLARVRSGDLHSCLNRGFDLV